MRSRCERKWAALVGGAGLLLLQTPTCATTVTDTVSEALVSAAMNAFIAALLGVLTGTPVQPASLGLV